MNRIPSRWRRPLAILLVILLTVGAACAWSAWRRNVTAQKEQDAIARQADRQRHGRTRTQRRDTDRLAATGLDRQGLDDLALRFEKATREWGTDPAAATDPADAGRDGRTVLDPLRTPDTMDRSAYDSVSSIPIPKGDGPDAPSPWCAASPDSAPCRTAPTMLDYRRANAWLMGARLDGTPRIDVGEDGTVDVTGRVRTVIWSDVQDAVTFRAVAGGSWWGYTPVTGITDFHDTLTVRDGKVSARRGDMTGWMADPWLGDWSEDPVEASSDWTDRRQDSIPLAGDPPSLGLSHDPTQLLVRNDTDTTGKLWEPIVSQPEQVEY